MDVKSKTLTINKRNMIGLQGVERDSNRTPHAAEKRKVEKAWDLCAGSGAGAGTTWWGQKQGEGASRET